MPKATAFAAPTLRGTPARAEKDDAAYTDHLDGLRHGTAFFTFTILAARPHGLTECVRIDYHLALAVTAGDVQGHNGGCIGNKHQVNTASLGIVG